MSFDQPTRSQLERELSPLLKIAAAGIVILLLVALALGITGNLGGSKTQQQASASISPAEVSITSSGFTPATISVKVGQAVVWTNNDTAEHEVTLEPQGRQDVGINAVAGPKLNPHDTYSYVFNQAGTFQYVDNLNPAIAAMTVIVQ